MAAAAAALPPIGLAMDATAVRVNSPWDAAEGSVKAALADTLSAAAAVPPVIIASTCTAAA